jgi:hypothetical protein
MPPRKRGRSAFEIDSVLDAVAQADRRVASLRTGARHRLIDRAEIPYFPLEQFGLLMSLRVKNDRFAVVAPLPLLTQHQTYRCAALSDVTGQQLSSRSTPRSYSAAFGGSSFFVDRVRADTTALFLGGTALPLKVDMPQRQRDVRQRP